VVNKKEDIPVLYLFVYSVLVDRFHYQYVHTTYILELLNRRLPRFPWCKHNKLLFYEILKEMEQYNLVRRENHKSYYIVPNTQIKRLQRLSTVPIW
jgi:hypothetical protein